MKLSEIKPNSIIELNGITYKWNGKELFHYLPWKNGNGVSEYPVLLGGIGWKEIMSDKWQYTYKPSDISTLKLFVGIVFCICIITLFTSLIMLYFAATTFSIVFYSIFSFFALFLCNEWFNLFKD